MIVPGVFERGGDACLAAGIGGTGIARRNDVGDPALFHVLVEVTAWPLGIGRVLAQGLVGTGVVEVDATLPGAVVEEHRMVAMERGVHVTALAGAIQLRAHDVPHHGRLEQHQQDDLVAARVPVRHRTVVVVVGDTILAVRVCVVLTLAGDHARAGERVVQRGVEQCALFRRAAGHLDAIEQRRPLRARLLVGRVEISDAVLRLEALLRLLGAMAVGDAHDHLVTGLRVEGEIGTGVVAGDLASIRLHVFPS